MTTHGVLARTSPGCSAAATDDRPWAELWIGAHPAAPSRPRRTARSLRGRDRGRPRATARRARCTRSFGDRLPVPDEAAGRRRAAVPPGPSHQRARPHPVRRAGRRRHPAGRTGAQLPGRLAQAGARSTRSPASRAWPASATRPRPRSDPARAATALARRDRRPASRQRRPPFQTLRAVVTEMLDTDGPELLRHRLRELRDGARPLPSSARTPALRGAGVGTADDPEQRSSAESCGCSPQTADARRPLPRPTPGVLVTLLLNHVVLAAGEAMFIDAGVIHAYTSGFGVEIMAASDNVLRAGLTPKHVDIPELLEVTNFTPIPPPLWASPLPAGELRRPRSFCAAGRGVRADGRATSTDELSLRSTGPQVVLCLEGHGEGRDGRAPRIAARQRRSWRQRATSSVTVPVGSRSVAHRSVGASAWPVTSRASSVDSAAAIGRSHHSRRSLYVLRDTTPRSTPMPSRKPDPGLPAGLGELGDVEQLLRGAVRLAACPSGSRPRSRRRRRRARRSP